MDVIINATPGSTVQMVPQQYVPMPGQTPYGYGPGYHRDGRFPGGFLVLLIVGAVLFFHRRRQGWRRWAQAGGPGTPAGGNLGDEVRDTSRRGRALFLNDQALGSARQEAWRRGLVADIAHDLRAP